MTAPTLTRSAYPKTVDELIPHARDLADQLGEVPSRNKLMKTFRVGSDKANALIEALTAAPVSSPPAGAEPPTEQASEPTVAGLPLPPVAQELLDAFTPAPAASAPPGVPPVGPIVAPPAPVAPAAAEQERRPVTWPVLILCLPAFVAIWGGWVEMGRLTGFGMVKLLPGIADRVELNTAITLPIGVETYAAFALWAWLSGRATGDARAFAKWSALASLGLGAAGQVAYHLMAAAGWTSAPWPITAAVSCIPVAVLGMGAALAHLMHHKES